MHKPSKFLSIARDLAKRSYQNLRREASLSWQFIGRDVSASMMPGLLCVIAAWNSSHSLSLGELLLTLGRGTIYFWFFIFPFCLSNQIVGIDEDRINKPDRPLITGAVSVEGVKLRLVVSMLLFPLVGLWFGVLEWALLWQLCIILYNFGGWAKHWFTKNLVMGVGTIAQLAAAWAMVRPIEPSNWCWILVPAGAWFFLAAVQDIRDIEGDRAIGRNTMPIAFGETISRLMLSLGFGILPLAIHFALMMPVGNTWNVLLCEIILTLVSWTIAARLIFCRSPRADRLTYMLYTAWFCLVLFSAIIVL